jgi:serine/threonine-protein kinase
MNSLQARLQTVLGAKYRVEQELGGGGMSRVFVAEQRELGRRVVVKVLPPEVAGGVNLDRFRREIQLAASLQHPHIVPLLTAGQVKEVLYYIMPLIEGESLRAKLAREGELPVPEAVRIMRDVVDALSHAHRHGIVHRDIKPDNVLISDRHAVVTDFGVAKALSESTGETSLTSVGVALGTPTYMAPEQAAADPHADYRCDIYAVGTLAYEMLTGRPPFTGMTPQQVLAAQVSEKPAPIYKFRPAVPPSLGALVMRCLEKSPADRWQAAADLLPPLEMLATPSGGITPTTGGSHPVAALMPGRGRWAVGAGAAALVALVTAGVIVGRREGAGVTLGKVTQLTFEPGLEIEPAISPDGKFLAYAAGPLTAMRIYIRQAGGRAIALGGEGASHRRPLWSPDGTRMLFETETDLYVMPALGGTPRLVARGACCAAWSPDGREIAYVRSGRRVGSTERPESISVAPADGRPARAVGVVFDPHSLAWSPDGRWIALVSGNDQFAVGVSQFANKGPSVIVLLPTAGGEPLPLTDNTALNVSPVWSPDSRSVLFVSDRDGPRDVYAVRLTRAGAPVARPARMTTGLNAHSISLSADGTRLAYAMYTSRANVWAVPIPTGGAVGVDRAAQITAGNHTVEDMAISPDGRWLYFDSDRAGNADLYRMPLGGGDVEHLTTDQADDFAPDVSPDGRWVAFHSLRRGTRDLFVMPAEGGEEQRITDDPGEERSPRWSSDGRSIVYTLTGTGARDGPYIVAKDEADRWGAPRWLGGTANWADWGPGGRSVLITDDAVWAVSVTGGSPRRDYAIPDGVVPLNARWSPDGRVIYLKGTDRAGRAAFWALAPAGGPPRLLMRFDDPTRSSSREEFMTDGRRLYFTMDDRQSDVYVAELGGIK